MSWNIMTVRSGDDIDDDTLYPVLGAVDSALVIDVDERDGQVQTVRAKGLTVFENTGRLEKRISVQDVKIDVYLTDRRIAISCEKWDKGGGVIGFGGAGIAFALAANGVSKIRAAVRRRNKAFVGHVRYNWLSAAGSSAKTGWASNEQLRLVCTEQAGGRTRSLILELTLPKDVEAATVAANITRRTARFRLQYDSTLSSADRAALEASTRAVRLANDPSSFAFHQLPGSQPANPATALTPGPAVPTAPARPLVPRPTPPAVSRPRPAALTAGGPLPGLSRPRPVPAPAPDTAMPWLALPVADSNGPARAGAPAPVGSPAAGSRACLQSGCAGHGEPVQHKFCGKCGTPTQALPALTPASPSCALAAAPGTASKCGRGSASTAEDASSAPPKPSIASTADLS